MDLLKNEDGDWSVPKIGGLAVVCLTTLIGGCSNITNNWKVSEGDRVGMINKLSEKGRFWNSYEGQMALEGVSSSGSSIGANVWDFSIDNYISPEKKTELTNQLKYAMDNGQKIKVHYVEMMGTYPWRSDSNHLIQSITSVEVKAPTYLPSNQQTMPEQVNKVSSNPYGLEVKLDGRNYVLKHDTTGKLKVIELKEVQ